MTRGRGGPLGEPWRSWGVLGVGVLAVTAHAALSIAVSVLMKSMVADFGWARTDFAFTMTARMLAMITVVAFAGALTDRLGARRVLATGAFLMAAGIFGMSRAGSWIGLAVVSIGIGAGQACVGAVAASALVLRLFRRRGGIAVGVLNGGDNLLNGALPILTAALLPDWGWRGTLGLIAVAYVALGALILAALSDDDGRTRSAPGTAIRLRDLPWGNSQLWTLLLAYAGVYAYITSIQLHLHAFQTDLGRSPEVASRLLSVQLLVGALGAPLFGWLAERTSARAALITVVGGLAVTSVVPWTATATAPFAVWAVVHGLVNSGVVALLALVLHQHFDPRQIGRLMGVASVICMSATILGNQFSAWAFDTFHSYRPAWQVYTVLLAGALVPVLRLRRAVPAAAAAAAGLALLLVGAPANARDVFDLVRHGYADSNGVRIHYASLGRGPLIVMIHGFPDFWYTWRHQMAGLARHYRVVAMDQRGYNLSDKPAAVEQYDLPLLMNDVAAVIADVGRDQAVVVGHDWGGAVAWFLAMQRPELVSRLIILNLPHPRALLRELRENPSQQASSAYARTFQESTVAFGTTGESFAGLWPEPTVHARYAEALGRSDMAAMLAYYKRNYPRAPYADVALPAVQPPVLLIHGLDDPFLLASGLDRTWEWVAKPLTLVTIPGAGHFVQQDAAPLVTKTIKRWLADQGVR